MGDNNDQEILKKIRRKVKFGFLKAAIDKEYKVDLIRIAEKLETDAGIMEAINIIDDPYIQAILAKKIKNENLKIQLLKGKLKDNSYSVMIIETLEEDEIKAEFLKNIKNETERASGATTFKDDKYKKMFFDMIDKQDGNASSNKSKIAISLESDELREKCLEEIKIDYLRKRVIDSFKDIKYVDKYCDEIKDDRVIVKKFYPEKIKEMDKERRIKHLIRIINNKKEKIKEIDNEIRKLEKEKEKYVNYIKTTQTKIEEMEKE